MHKSILQKDKSYTFSDYFNLSYPTKEIVTEFGYIPMSFKKSSYHAGFFSYKTFRGNQYTDSLWKYFDEIMLARIAGQ